MLGSSARLILVSATVSIGLLGGGCYQEPVAIRTFPPTPVPRVTILPRPSPTGPPTASIPATRTPAATATPIPLSTPSPSAAVAVGGSPSPGCVNGWTSPAVGSAEHVEGLELLEAQMGVAGPWTVDEMRYFVGPDAPGIIEPSEEAVERWYIRAALAADPGFRARWLVEKRTDEVAGIAAVATWDSTGYESPDWTGFVGEGEPQTYLGLPGQWPGVPYDFVTGGDSGNPGLPSEVVDCLAGT